MKETSDWNIQPSKRKSFVAYFMQTVEARETVNECVLGIEMLPRIPNSFVSQNNIFLALWQQLNSEVLIINKHFSRCTGNTYFRILLQELPLRYDTPHGSCGIIYFNKPYLAADELCIFVTVETLELHVTLNIGKVEIVWQT